MISILFSPGSPRDVLAICFCVTQSARYAFGWTRLVLLGVLDEVRKDPEPGLPALLGMELRPDDVAGLAGGDGGEVEPVVTGRDGVVGHGRPVRVDEIGVVAVLDPLDDRVVALDGQFVPAHVRDLHAVVREPLDASRDEVEPVDGPVLGSALGALGEHELESHADAQNRGILGGLDEDVVERPGVADALAVRAHAGEHERGRRGDLGRVIRDGHGRAGPLQPAPETPEVPDPVVDNGDVHTARSYSWHIPFFICRTVRQNRLVPTERSVRGANPGERRVSHS